jgi:hypothetical protein
MAVRKKFASTSLASKVPEFDQETLQDVALACVEGCAVVYSPSTFRTERFMFKYF